MAIANSLAAASAGAAQVEGTINGIGERAGNAALEEFGVALHIRKDFYQAETKMNLNEISRTSSLVSKLTGMMVPANKAVVGRNAFAHESGIHQDGVLKEKTTYEIISPELVGLQNNSMVLGKHSGRHAFRNRLNEIGLAVPDQDINHLFSVFKELADRKKEMTDEDLAAIILEETLSKEQQYYRLNSIQVQYGTNQVPTATVSLSGCQNELIQEASTGSGSIEALYNTLEKCMKESANLLDYRIQSVGAGRDALAQVYVKLRFAGTETSGRGLAQDVLEASAKAYLNAVNRVLYMEENKKIAARERKQQLQYLFIGIFIPGFFLLTLLLSRIRIHSRVIRILGILSLLILFEYLTLLLHPKVAKLTNHTPVYEMLIFVSIASLLIPAHHRIEAWLIKKLTHRKNGSIKLKKVNVKFKGPPAG